MQTETSRSPHKACDISTSFKAPYALISSTINSNSTAKKNIDTFEIKQPLEDTSKEAQSENDVLNGPVSHHVKTKTTKSPRPGNIQPENHHPSISNGACDTVVANCKQSVSTTKIKKETHDTNSAAAIILHPDLEQHESEKGTALSAPKNQQTTLAKTPSNITSRHTVDGKWSDNYLPPGFIDDETDPMRYFFSGFYVGDGVYLSKRPGFTIKIKSSEFMDLYSLLLRCGVPNPQLNFYKMRRISTKYNAGHLGVVVWGYSHRHESCLSLVDHGLPSSRAKHSDPELLKSFLPDHNRKQRGDFFLLFMLGYLMADESVRWEHAGNQQQPVIRYQYVRLFAKDANLLTWMCNELAYLGCDSLHLGTASGRADTNREENPNSTTMKCERSLNYLAINKSEANFAVLRRGIELLEKHSIPLNGKIHLLKDFCQSNGRLPPTLNRPTNLSFHQYIRQVASDRVACVIAQDLYEFNVFFLNNLLSAVGFQEEDLESVYDFDLAGFIVFIRGLRNQANRSVLQELLLQYYHLCELRITQGTIFDYRYKEPLYQQVCCSECHILCRRSYLREHMLRMHLKGELFKCRYQGCDQQFTDSDKRRKHYAMDHCISEEEEKLSLTCQVEGCKATPFRGRISLERHIRSYHTSLPTREVLRCSFQGCAAEFRTHSSLKTHQNAHQALPEARSSSVACWDTKFLPNPWQISLSVGPFFCGIDGCSRAYKSIYSYKRHVKSKHPAFIKICQTCAAFKYVNDKELQAHRRRCYDPSIEYHKCDYPGCEKRYRCITSVYRHKKNTH